MVETSGAQVNGWQHVSPFLFWFRRRQKKNWKRLGPVWELIAPITATSSFGSFEMKSAPKWSKQAGVMQAIFSYLQHQRVSPPCRLISVFFLPMLSWNISLCSRELLSLLFCLTAGLSVCSDRPAPPCSIRWGGDLPPFGNVVTPQNPIFAAEILQRSAISVPPTSWWTVKEETGEDAAVRLLQKIPSAD